MSGGSGQKQPKEYIRRMPLNWWLQRKTYIFFMARELTSVFVGAYALLLLVLVDSASDTEAFNAFFTWLESPLSIVLHVIALVMVLFHSITWFDLTGKAMFIWRGEERVSPRLISAASYVAWVVVSIVVAWIVISSGAE